MFSYMELEMNGQQHILAPALIPNEVGLPRASATSAAASVSDRNLNLTRLRKKLRATLIVLGVVSVCVIAIFVSEFVIYSDLESKYDALMERVNATDLFAKRAFFEVHGVEKEDRSCDSDSAYQLRFEVGSDPDQMLLAGSGKKWVKVKQAGYYSLEFRAIRQNVSLSCNVTMEIRNEAGNVDSVRSEKFNCPHGTGDGSVIAWTTVKCLDKGDTVGLKAGGAKSFRCVHGQKLNFLGVLLRPPAEKTAKCN